MKNWPRYEEAKKLRDAGTTYAAIGMALGVGGGRARQMVAEYEHRLARLKSNPCPPEWSDGLSWKIIRELKQAGINSKEECVVICADELATKNRRVILRERGPDEPWSYLTESELPLKTVNIVREWLGVKPFIPKPRVIKPAEIERAKRLLESQGYRVVKPE